MVEHRILGKVIGDGTPRLLGDERAPVVHGAAH